MKSLGVRLKAIRNARGMTQLDTCKGICDRTLLSHVESGRVLPSLDLLQRLCKSLGVSVADVLMEGNQDEESEKMLDKLYDFVVEGYYVEAVNFGKRALSMEVIRQDNEASAKCLLLIGSAFDKLLEYKEALHFLKGAYELSGSCSAQTQYRCINAYAAVLINIGAYEEALELLLTVYRLSKLVQPKDQTLVRIICNIANAAHQVGNLSLARRYVLEGVDVSRKSGVHECWGHLETINGLIDLQKSDFKRARNSFERALKKYESLEDLTGVVGSLINLAETALYDGECDCARSYLDRGRHLVDSIPQLNSLLDLLEEVEKKYLNTI